MELEIKKVISKDVEEKVITTILDCVTENNLTISNLKEIVAMVIEHMEDNAVIEKGELK